MAAGAETKVALAIVAVVVAAFAAYEAATVFAPLVLALFIIAIVWPLQRWLQARMPKLLALAITLIVIVAVGVGFASLVAWGFGRVGRALMNDASRYQAFYDSLVAWLDSHGVSIAGLWAEHFNVRWLLGKAQIVTGRINSMLAFWLIALTYVILGLLEVDDIGRRVESASSAQRGARDHGRQRRNRGQIQKISAGQDTDERADRVVRRAVRARHRPAIRRRVGRHRVRAELHSLSSARSSRRCFRRCWR